MSHTTKIMLGVYLLTLPACYYTPVPSILAAIVFVFLYVHDKDEAPQLPQSAQVDLDKCWASLLDGKAELLKAQKELEELRSEVNGIQLRAGLGKKT